MIVRQPNMINAKLRGRAIEMKKEKGDRGAGEEIPKKNNRC